jgi:hypothetical protein
MGSPEETAQALATRILFTVEAAVSAPVAVGDPGGGVRRYIPITSGRFSGSISGRVLPGTDWQTVLPDGTIELSAHYALETDTGDRIEVVSEGLRAGPPEILQRLAAGEAVDPSLYYFRTAMRFRTGAPSLARLNAVLAVAVAERQAQLVKLVVHEIL